MIENVKREKKVYDFIFYDKLPNENLKLLTSKDSINLTTLINGKPTKFIFWATWCLPCLKEMEDIYSSKLYESLNIVSLFSAGDILEARTMIDSKKYPWLFLESTEKINKIFSQNGYPFTVDFDKDGNKIK